MDCRALTITDPKDLAEIHQLVHRYAIAVDVRDEDALACCFSPDGVLVTSGRTLKGDIAPRVIKLLSTHFVRTMHCIFNPSYEIAGHRATGTAYCIASHVRRSGSSHEKVDWHIRYEDELRKIEERWFIQRRELHLLFTTAMPVELPE